MALYKILLARISSLKVNVELGKIFEWRITYNAIGLRLLISRPTTEGWGRGGFSAESVVLHAGGGLLVVSMELGDVAVDCAMLSVRKNCS